MEIKFKQDYDEALKWYQQAATQGHTESMYRLAWAYSNGLGVETDHKEALAWYHRAAR